MITLLDDWCLLSTHCPIFRSDFLATKAPNDFLCTEDCSSSRGYYNLGLKRLDVDSS